MKSVVLLASAAAFCARGALSDATSAAPPPSSTHGLGQWIVQGMGGYPAAESATSLASSTTAQPTSDASSSATGAHASAANVTATIPDLSSSAAPSHVDMVMGDLTYAATLVSSGSVAVLPFTKLTLGGPAAAIGKATVSLGSSGIVVVHAGKTSTAAYAEPTANATQAATPATDATAAVDLKEETQPTQAADTAQTAGSTQITESAAQATEIDVAVGRMTYPVKIMSSGSVAVLPFTTLTLSGPAATIGKATVSLGDSGIVVAHAGKTSTAGLPKLSATSTPSPTQAPSQAVVMLGDLVYTADLVSSGSVAKFPHAKLTLGGPADRIGKATISMAPSGIVVVHAGETSTASFS